MKVLAICYALPPMLYPQAIQIGRLLSHSQHDVVAISGGEAIDKDGFGSRVEHHVVPFHQEPKGRLHTLARHAVPFYGSVPDPFRGWINSAFSAVERIIGQQGKPDLIATFGEPMSDHLLGLRLKQTFGIPWLAHFSDPWSDSPFRNIQPLSKLANRPLERSVVEAADRIVFVSEETVDLVCRKYASSVRERCSVLPHSFDPAAYGSKAEQPMSDRIVLRYIGNFYGNRSPKPLIRALSFLARNDASVLDGVSVELVGGIPQRMHTAAWKGLPEGLLIARGSVSYAQSLQLMKASDILLTIDAPARESVFFPSKLADYIGSGRRLVGLVPPGAAARIIDHCGGRSISPSAPVESVAGLLRDEINAVRTGKERGEAETRRQRNGSQFEIVNVAPRFDELCRATIESARRRSGVRS